MISSAASGMARPVSREPWRTPAERMAARLVAEGHIRDSRWRDAFACTPRHLLLPETDVVATAGGEPPSWWLEAVYTDAPQDTASGANGWPAIAPSQPPPAVLAWLLDLLIPDEATTPDGDAVRVLEVGAGRGYTTALLCHRLGAEQVTATDPYSADHTRALLAELDLYPCLVAAQGVRGASAHGPFDAILCAARRTESASHAWLAQLADGGRIVAAVRGPDTRIAANVYERSESGRQVQTRTVTREPTGSGIRTGAP